MNEKRIWGKFKPCFGHSTLISQFLLFFARNWMKRALIFFLLLHHDDDKNGNWKKYYMLNRILTSWIVTTNEFWNACGCRSLHYYETLYTLCAMPTNTTLKFNWSFYLNEEDYCDVQSKSIFERLYVPFCWCWIWLILFLLPTHLSAPRNTLEW